MTQPPLWKRIGIHKLRYGTEAERSTSQKVVSQRGRSTNSHDHQASSGLFGVRDSVLVQTARLLSPPSKTLELPQPAQNQEHCLKSLLDQFREMDELEKSVASQLIDHHQLEPGKQPKKEVFSSPKASVIAAESQRSSESTRVRPQIKKQPVVVLFLKQLRGEISKIRDTVLLEKARFQEDMQIIMSKTAVLLNKHGETVPTQNKVSEGTRSYAESKNFSLVFDTIEEESKPKEETREQTQSDDWQRTNATLLQHQSQLRQNIEKLNNTIHVLELQLSNSKKQRQADRLLQQQSHKNLLQILTEGHTLSLRQCRQSYSKLLDQKDSLISSLTSQLTQKNDNLLRIQKRQRESQLEIQSNLNNVYIKKYKDLYEKSETEKIKLQNDCEDLKRELQVVSIELEGARKDSHKVFEEKMEMLKRVEELNSDMKGKVHEVKKTLMLDYRQKVEELEEMNEGMRGELKERERVIEAMRGELESLQVSIAQLREEIRIKDALGNSDDDQSQFLTTQPQPNLIRHAQSQTRHYTIRTLVPPLQNFKTTTQSTAKDQKIKQIVSDRNMHTIYKGPLNKRQAGSIETFVSPIKRPTKINHYNEKSPYMLKTNIIGMRNKEKLAEYTARSEQKGLVTLQARVQLLRKMMQSDLQSSLRKAY